MSVDIDIIIRVFVKKIIFLKSINKGITTIIVVPMQGWWNFSSLFSSSRGDECSR